MGFFSSTGKLLVGTAKSTGKLGVGAAKVAVQQKISPFKEVTIERP